MTRNEFIQQYLIACATNNFPKDGIHIAIEIADELEKIAPFDKGQLREAQDLIADIDKERKNNVLKDSLDKYHEHYGIPMKSINALCHFGIYTIGDLIKYKRCELLRMNNVGRKSISCFDELLEDLCLNYSTN